MIWTSNGQNSPGRKASFRFGLSFIFVVKEMFEIFRDMFFSLNQEMTV